MSGNTTTNTDALIRATVYSDIILETLNDGLLPDGLHRDVSEFTDGSLIEIPLMGEVVLRDIDEDNDIPLDAIDTGKATLTINRFKGAGSYLTGKFRDDSRLSAQFDAALPPAHARAVAEAYETDLLAQVQKQAIGSPNTINRLAHRFVASGTGQQITLADLIYLKLAFDKAGVPDKGRVLIVDPIVEATINGLQNIVNVSNNPRFEGIIETGFGKANQFLRTIVGFDIFISNRLPEIVSETINTSTIGTPAPSGNATVTTGVACVAMSVLDDMTTPIMGAWRRMPRTEGVRNGQRDRDEFYTTARWGFGVQRFQTLGAILCSSVNY